MGDSLVSLGDKKGENSFCIEMLGKALHRTETSSRDLADKFIRNEFEQLNEMKLPRSGEVHGRTS